MLRIYNQSQIFGINLFIILYIKKIYNEFFINLKNIPTEIIKSISQTSTNKKINQSHQQHQNLP